MSGSSAASRAACASSTAACPMSRSYARRRAVSSAWTMALTASVSWLSSIRPYSNTAPTKPARAPPSESAWPYTRYCRARRSTASRKPGSSNDGPGVPRAIRLSAMPEMSTSLSAYTSPRRSTRCSVRRRPIRPRSRKTIRLVAGSTRTLPGCGSRVEEAVDEDLLDDRPHERRPELARVEAGLAEAVGIGDLDAVDELHRQHAAGRQVLVHDRDVDLLEPRHRVGEPSGVIRLVPVVELLEDARSELADDLPDARPAERGRSVARPSSPAPA